MQQRTVEEISLPLQNKTQPLTLDEVVKSYIQEVLTTTHGRINGAKGAAAILGVHPNTLRNRMRKLGIPFGRKFLK
jgi:transcriptional regulator with GAF, ATPase, and Fis domain